MAVSGFFTRQELKMQSRPQAEQSVELMHHLGLRGVEKMNPSARTPCMEPVGSEDPDVYVLGHFPTAEDDEAGEAFSDPCYKQVIGFLDSHGIESRYSYIVRTRTPKGREPKLMEVECFRPSIEEDILATKPAVIVGFGYPVFRWMMGAVKGARATLVRGRKFPVSVKGHECWFIPMLDPTWLAGDWTRYEKVSKEDWKRTAAFDLEFLLHTLESSDAPAIEATDKKSLEKGISLYRPKAGAIKELLKKIKKLGAVEKPLAIDIETTTRRPYETGSRILSIAIGTYEETVSFVFDHPTEPWTLRDFELLRRAVYEFLVCRKGYLIAHHAGFELEHLSHFYGFELTDRLRWHDTMIQAYILDERTGGHSLNFCCLERLGVALKQLTTVDRGRLSGESVEDLLLYNALDTKYTHKLFNVQRRLIREQGLVGAYRDRVRLVNSLVGAQLLGLPVKQSVVRKFKTKLSTQVDRIEKEIQEDREVVKYRKRFGEFNPYSGKQLTVLLRDMLGRKEGVQKNGTFSTEKESLLAMKDLPLAGKIVSLRESSKLQSTYIDPLDITNPKTIVFPDGRLHCTFNTCIAATGRLSAEDPNVQNFPKRHNGWVRRMIAAPKGHSLVASDYGQIEARVIAMLSKDPSFMKSLWEDMDVHRKYAEWLADRYPPIYKRYNKDIGALRSDVKNKLVFPAFYLAHEESIGKSLGLPSRITSELFECFWDEFAGIRGWQDGLVRFYKQHGYVECMNGRRRRGPLNNNMIVNTPVQGSSSDIVVDAMARCAKVAFATDRPYLHPVLNIHDDLTFLVPDEALEDAIESIVKEMVRVPFDWITVPISIEVAVGKNWYDMEEIGKFDSREVL